MFMIFHVWIIILFFVSNVFAGDLLLYSNGPIQNEPNYFVETYFREGKNWYFFTVAFRLRMLMINRYKTKITFSQKDARIAHVEIIHWLKRAYSQSIPYGIDVLEERIQICPFNPFDSLQEEESPKNEKNDVFMIRTSISYDHQDDSIREK
jgi:hypothetical protein